MFGRKKEPEKEVVKDNFIDITPESENDLFMREVLQTLFSSNSDKIIQSAEYDQDGLRDIYMLETFLALILIKYGSFDTVIKYRVLIDRLLQATVSLNRKGREELFTALQPTQQFLTSEDLRGRKKGLFG